MKAQDFCSPKGPRLGSCGCLGLDSVPSQSGRSKAAYSQPIWRKTFDGLLLMAPRQPPQPGTPPSQLVFTVLDICSGIGIEPTDICPAPRSSLKGAACGCVASSLQRKQGGLGFFQPARCFSHHLPLLRNPAAGSQASTQ